MISERAHETGNDTDDNDQAHEAHGVDEADDAKNRIDQEDKEDSVEDTTDENVNDDEDMELTSPSSSTCKCTILPQDFSKHASQKTAKPATLDSTISSQKH